MSFVSEDPNNPNPSYVALSRAADSIHWRDVPRWRFIKRRKMREEQRTLSLASVMAYRSTWET